MSLQNLISTVLDSIPLPALLQWKESSVEVMDEKEQLQKEVTVLKMKLQDTAITEDGSNSNKQLVTRSDIDLAEDFCIVSTTGKSPDVPKLAETLSFNPTRNFTTLNAKMYRDHVAPLTFARFSCEGMFCATSDTSGTLKVWAFSPEVKTLHSFVFKSGIYSVHWARKMDKLLFVGTGGSAIKLINISNRKITHELIHPTTGLNVIALASNQMCTHLVSSAKQPSHSKANKSGGGRSGGRSSTSSNSSGDANPFGEVVVWDCKTREMIQILEVSPLPSPLTSLHFNHNGSLLVCGALDGMVRVYGDYQCIMGWQAHTHPIHTVRFSVDENSVFSYSRDGVLTQWRLYPMSQSLHSVTVNKEAQLSRDVNSASLLADTFYDRDFALDAEGKYLLTYRGQQAVIYNIEDGFLEDTVLPAQGSPVSCVDWHVPYSTRLCLTASLSGVARINSLLC